MVDVVAGQLLGPSLHLLPADDAHIVSRSQFLGSGVGEEVVHGVDGLSRHDDVVDCFLEGADSQVEGADGEEGEGVQFDHHGNEHRV